MVRVRGCYPSGRDVELSVVRRRHVSVSQAITKVALFHQVDMSYDRWISTQIGDGWGIPGVVCFYLLSFFFFLFFLLNSFAPFISLIISGPDCIGNDFDPNDYGNVLGFWDTSGTTGENPCDVNWNLCPNGLGFNFFHSPPPHK
jgi:hypothetical protein